MTDRNETNLSTAASLIVIGCLGITIGLFLYFAVTAVDDTVRMAFGPS